ncbi:prenylated rab acceptor PRA1 [Xylariales sp. PMI_506]|nr:prenylated rab acceptor PRA1 [Xylariales sp. PMI_506]
MQTNMRLVSEVLDIKHVSVPSNFAQIILRVKQNVGRFSYHYSAVFIMLGIYSILTNWVLLLDLIFIMIGALAIHKLNGGYLQVGRHQITSSRLYTFLCVTVLYMAFRSSFIATILSTISTGVFVTLLHATLIDKPAREDQSYESHES